MPVESKVSIIIPVYNVEKYIERCIRSLFSQTLNDIEYIFINDCGTDKSIEILQTVLNEYPHRKKQVIIINHTQNTGVSKSRQDGVDSATGEYIIHVDPDDWIESNMCAEMYEAAIQKEADMLITDFFINGKEEKISNQKPSAQNANSVLLGLFDHIHGSTWNKLIRRDFIKKHKIIFNSQISYCEDLLYNISILKHNPKIHYIPKSYYHYYYDQNPNSITRLYDENELKKDIYLRECILKLTEGTTSYMKSDNYTSYLIAWRAFRGSQFTSKEFARRFRGTTIKILYSNAPILIKTLLVLSCIGAYKIVKKIYVYYKTR